MEEHGILVAALARRIGARADDCGAADWREHVERLRAESGASDEELARAVRDVVQGRTPDARWDEGCLRRLAHYLFVETARADVQALVAVPRLLGDAERGRVSFDGVLAFAEAILPEP
jgi:hypothetical protein